MSFDVQGRGVTVFRVRSTGRADFSPPADQWTGQNMEVQQTFRFDGWQLRRAPMRRHRLGSNLPVRLTPRADAGSCSSLQFSHAQAGSWGTNRAAAEIMRGHNYANKWKFSEVLAGWDRIPVIGWVQRGSDCFVIAEVWTADHEAQHLG